MKKIDVKIYDSKGRERICRYLASCKQIVDLGCNQKPIREDAVGYDYFSEYGIQTDFNVDGLSKIDSRIDGISMSHILEHIIDTRKFLKECHSKLSSGGRIAIACPDGENVKPKTLGDSAMTHEMLFSGKTLRLYLLHAGFKNVIVEYYDRPYLKRKVRGIFAGAVKG